MNKDIRLMARFRPQAWVNDYAVDIDDGGLEFDATRAYLGLPYVRARAFRPYSYDSDNLYWDTEVDHSHQGPFEVDVDVDDWLRLQGIDGGMTEAQFAGLQKFFAEGGQ